MFYSPRWIRCVLAAFTLLTAAWAPARAAGEADVNALIAQLENRGCRYSENPLTPCSSGTPLSGWMRRLDPLARYRCALGAAHCLESLGASAAPAVPALLRALREGPNDYDTGDGLIATRSAIASALGAIGDPRAIDPLAEALKSAVPADRGAGAIASREPAARLAIVEALGRFGRSAGRHWSLIGAVLRERNADLSYLEQQREQYEQSAAMDLVIEELKRRHPESTSFEVPPDQIEQARHRLDRSDPGYVREFEARSRDPLATAAAEALGHLGRAEAAPLLIETLKNPAAAGAAASALAELRHRSPAATEALRAVFASRNYGPSTKARVARALGRLGDERSVGLLAAGLVDPELCEACADGLGEMGSQAQAALPALQDILRQPSLAQRSHRGTVYGVDATRQLANQIAAVRAIERIDLQGTLESLGRYSQYPDIGAAVRRALRHRQLERTGALQGRARR
jgi:hypothetical protein